MHRFLIVLMIIVLLTTTLYESEGWRRRRRRRSRQRNGLTSEDAEEFKGRQENPKLANEWELNDSPNMREIYEDDQYDDPN
ncbi:hypothetical protein AC249_AIPGENE8385 [Exaiptasia diaphana]|nr:hypothetical protein AC249_AIPGENE8385 [Exaiptasia diaphana]